jgi:hypothetical protein
MVPCWRKYDTPINENQWVGFTVEAREIHLLELRGAIRVMLAVVVGAGLGCRAELLLHARHVGLHLGHVGGQGLEHLHHVSHGGRIGVTHGSQRGRGCGRRGRGWWWWLEGW